MIKLKKSNITPLRLLINYCLLIILLSACEVNNQNGMTASCVKFETTIAKLKPIVQKLNDKKENCYPCNGDGGLNVYWSTASVDFKGNNDFEASLWGLYSQAKSENIISGNINDFMKKYYSNSISRNKRAEIIKHMEHWLKDPQITDSEYQQIKEAISE
jgi:hypothetical protein